MVLGASIMAEYPAHCSPNQDEVPIAIIGMAFEFAQDVVSEESFWQLLCEGRSTASDFPKDRLNIDAFHHQDDSRPSSLSFRGGNFVKEDLGAFDAPFFSITPGEAACMDPQHRRLLEVSYHALENAGIPLTKACGSNTSVYTGCFTHDYFNVLQHDHENEQRHAALGVPASMLANRISWFFDFKGPSTNLDSACSSAMMALHLACQDLRTKVSTMGLVGGANFIFHPDFSQMLSNFGFISPDSRSWSFDERANGYSRGEGTAAILVKRLDDAIRDGDLIRAVIRGTGSNQDGRTPGITQPSQEAQLQLIRETFERANINMEPTRFFEAHGTGTVIGDPTEAQAIGRAFSSYRSSEQPLYIGAVKSNLGHLEGASGLAGVIKAILVLEKGIIPPIAGLKNLNHRIDAKHLHLAWPSSGLRRACVNSFGFGGSNSIVILDDAFHYLQSHHLNGNHHTITPAYTNGHCENGKSQITNGINCNLNTSGLIRPTLLVSSGNDRDSAAQLAKDIERYAGSHKYESTDIAFALAQRRNHYTWRSFHVLNPSQELDSSEHSPAEPFRSSKDHATAWIFTGQGAQFKGMGYAMSVFPQFRDSLDLLDRALREIGCQWSLHEVLGANNTNHDIHRPEYSQTVTTCLQIALVDLLKGFGIVPSVVIGHSSGEIAAAYAVGALSQSSAVRVAYWRGKMSSYVAETTPGLGMTAVGISKSEVSSYLERLEREVEDVEVTIGCVNSPASVTLTGRSSQLTILETWFQQRSIFFRRLRVDVAYHSPFMQSIAEMYQSAMGLLEPGVASKTMITMVSSVTGFEISPDELCLPDYWVRNMVSHVEFEKAFNRLASMSNSRQRKQLGRKSKQAIPIASVLEIGPHSALQGAVRDCLQKSPAGVKLKYIPSQLRNSSAPLAFLRAVGALYCTGYPVDLLAVNGLEDKQRPLPSKLPLYPFNHKQSYWKESRFSKNYRFRDFARHDLLGTRSLDWNKQVAQWRNVIRLREVPWLQDHRINGQIIFPGAGMIVMAVEALKQLMPTDIPLRGIKIQDAEFMHPMRMSSETNSLEIQLNIIIRSSVPISGEWSRFRLFLIEEGDYVECCQGLIAPVTTEAEVERMMHGSSFQSPISRTEWLDTISQSVNDECLDPYSQDDSTGIQYGPTFQNVRSMRLGDGGQATATIYSDSWVTEASSEWNTQFSIHPTTLDGLAQLIVPALTLNGQQKLPAMVPTSADTIFINLSVESLLCKNDLYATASCRLRSKRGAVATILATSTRSQEPLILFEGLKTSFIETSTGSDLQQDFPTRHLCTQLIWKPDVSLLTNAQIHDYCLRARPQNSSQVIDQYKMIDLAIMYFVEQALEFKGEGSTVPADGHLGSYYDWLRYQKQRLSSGDLKIDPESLKLLLKSPDTRENLLKSVEESGSEGLFFVQIGRHLSQVLRGELNPLDLMFQSGMADRYYQEVLVEEHRINSALSYLELLAFKNPSMKILEIGAGTGGQTLRIMDSLASDGAMKWAQYDYTDVSPSFFERARTRLQKYSSTIKFSVCDVSQDVLSQSFEPSSYDLVIAAHVLHATNNINTALCNIKKLLKPGGKLLLAESTRPENLRIGFAFGLLKSWWDAMDYEPRSHLSPCISTSDWHQRLQLAGFTGVDVEFSDSEDQDCHYTSFIVSGSALPSTKPSFDSARIALIIDHKIPLQSDMVAKLQSRLSGCISYCLADLSSADLAASTVLIFLVEMNARLLESISKSDFEALKIILSKYKTTVWVSYTDSGLSDPSHYLVHGFGRSLSSEDASRKFVTLNLDRAQYSLEMAAEKILVVAQHACNAELESVENDYVAASDGLEIARISKNQDMNMHIARKQSNYHIREVEIKDKTRLAIHHSTLGTNQAVELWEDKSTKTLPDEYEVVIKVKALGLTHRDSLVLAGQIDSLDLFSECAGIVHAAGERSGFYAGDRVCVVAPSTGRTYLCVNSESVINIPEMLSFEEAVALLSAIWLSYHILVEIARTGLGDYVLIHRASSSFGQVVIQLAQSLGAHVLVTVGSDDKRNSICEMLNIDKDSILDSMDPLLSAKIAQVTSGHGVDLIVGALGLNPEIDFARCAALSGRIVDICLTDFNQSNTVPSLKVKANILMTKVDMMMQFRENPVQAVGTLRRAIEAATTLGIQPPRPLHLFDLSSVEDAISHLQDTKNAGKCIVNMTTGTKVMASVITQPSSSFSAAATYIIAGGLGGLGRVIAKWMVSRGARNLILLSRSGVRTEAAQKIVEAFKEAGVVCETPVVDISNALNLQDTINKLTKTMPPIRGCVQATVALRDNLFENMSHDDWSVSISSKVTGSWNLHQALPGDLDFFVLLSSIGGVYGARAQTNYAAGNTYKDGLAKYRVSRGLKAVSIDLGFMVDEGVVAENSFLLDSMKRIGLLMEIKTEEMLALLDYYCDARLPLLSESNAQIMTGFELPSIIKANGFDLHHALSRPMASHLFHINPNPTGVTTVNGGVDSVTIDRVTKLAQAKSEAEASDIISEWFLWKLGLMLGLSESDIELSKPLHTYGIDSLVAIDLKNWLQRQIGVEMTVFELLENMPLSGIISLAMKRREIKLPVPIR